MRPILSELSPKDLTFIESVREALKNVRRGLGLAWQSSPAIAFLIFALTLIAAALAPTMAFVGKLIIDAVVAADVRRTLEMVAAEFVLLALSAITQRSLFLGRSLLGGRLGIKVNTLILEKAASLDLTQIENSEFYDKMNRARMEASNRSLAVVNDSFQLVQNTLTLFGYTTLLFSFSGWAILAMVVASIPATWAEMKFSNIGFKLYNWRSPERRKMAYMEHVLSNDSHAKELRTFSLAPRFLGQYIGLAEKFYREDLNLSLRRTGWVIALLLLSSAAFYGCYAWIALEAARGFVTLGNLTLYVVVFRQGQQAFQSCLAAIGGMYEHNLYLSNLFDFLELSPSKRPERPRPNTENSGIFFDRVSFRYPTRETWALKNFTLHIPPGQSVAIVGSNGAGKSTMIKLLCGLYEPTEGAVFLDKKDLRDWAPAELLKRMSMVFQDFNKYQLTIQENVGVGEITRVDSAPEVERAMHKGGAQELLTQMPAGLQTTLGAWFPGGRELSGGQWQKVAVSRAFMRSEADILVLDEPTAALDPEAESLAFQKFHELTKGKTSLIISHRFPVARLAEKIVVIDQGEIIEQGTHEELMRLGGRYAHLFTLQAKGYD